MEYLDDPAARPQIRVLLLYDLRTAEVEVLRDAVDRLSRGRPGEEVRVNALPGVVAVGGCSLVAAVGGADLGVEPSHSDLDFRCELSASGWERVSGLLEPFLAPDSRGFQYLSEEGAVEWIISHDRGW
jgi:hypothetical protein